MARVVTSMTSQTIETEYIQITETMKDFIFRNDTKLIFRNDIRSTIADVAKGHKVMFVYGSGSVKTNGCHGDIVQTLNDTGISLVEYGGSSRELAAIEQGIRVARENDICMIIGAGGATPFIPRSIRTVRNTFLKKKSTRHATFPLWPTSYTQKHLKQEKV